ncbi:hypothetical protein O3G_MSEX009908 [Manduca sexta]|uniref:Uncharacterized protein n=1 Tax=Manduca sexta TaxID=7130 RepID=A0A922CSP6_MANSE|nr:hypothetical protein O3G_MSEX009908 [Manduca sexta]
MNRLVLLFALVAIAYARPESEMVDLDVDSSAGADFGKADLSVSYIPRKGVKFGEGVGNAHQKGPNAVNVAEEMDVGVVNAADRIGDLSNDGNSDSNVQRIEDDLSVSLIPVQNGAADRIGDLSNDGNSDSNVQGIEDDLSVSLIPVQNGAADRIGDLSNDGNSDSNVQGIEDDLSVSLIPVQNGAAARIGELSDPKSHH